MHEIHISLHILSVPEKFSDNTNRFDHSRNCGPFVNCRTLARSKREQYDTKTREDVLPTV